VSVFVIGGKRKVKMSRDAFLQRVRRAARAGQAHRVDQIEIPADTGYIGSSGDVCEVFVREVNEVGGQAMLVHDLRSARLELARLLVDYRARSALCWQHALLGRLGLSEVLDELQITRLDFDGLSNLSPLDRRTTLLDADIGITTISRAIAETGTLVMWSSPHQERLASLLPPVHIAIVARDQIVPDLIDATNEIAALNFDDVPSNISLITGPSKTGDIELQLTTGVHGPGKWHVIVVTDPT
jgi:L-lactate dehydrogenase complex protein LldG